MIQLKLHLNSSENATAFLDDENEIKEMENWLKTQGVWFKLKKKDYLIKKKKKTF